MEKKKIGLIILDIIIVVILIIGIILIWKILENGNGRMYYRMHYPDASVFDRYNKTFEEYESETQKGTNVKGLIDTVQQHNLANQDDMSRWVIFTGSVDAEKIVKLQNSIDEPSKQTQKIKEHIIKQDTYEVKCLYSKKRVW